MTILRSPVPIIAALLYGSMVSLPSAAQPVDPDCLNNWRALIDQSDQFYQQGRFDQAALVAEKALRYAEKLPPLDFRIPATMHALGFLYQQQARYSEAANLYLHAVRLWEQMGPEQKDNLELSLNCLTATYLQEREFRAARKLIEQHLPKMEQAASSDADRAVISNTRGTLATLQGHWAEALRHYQAALDFWERNLPATAREAAIDLVNMAHVFDASGHPEQALDRVTHALAILGAFDPSGRPIELQALDNAGALCVKLKRLSDAASFFERAVEVSKAAFGEEHLLTGVVELHYASVLHTLRQDRHARELEAEAHSVLDRNQRLTVDVHALLPPRQ